MNRKQLWVLLLGSVASLMAALDTLVVSTALSSIRRELDASIAELEWTVNAYNLSFAVLLMTAAAAGDRLGRRRMFAAGVALFTLASAACALAGDVGTLIAARVVQGAGAALVTTLALALVSTAFPTERRGAAIGILEGVTGMGVALGPLVGGAVADGLAWQAIFWLNVPIGLIAVPLALRKLPESFGPDGAFDFRGVALVTGGTFAVVWALVRGNTVGWGSPETVVTLVAGVLLAVAFVRWERRAPHPMMPLGFFRSRAFSAGNVAIFCTFAALFLAVFFFAQYLQTGLGYGAFEAGLRLLPWTVTLFLCAPVAGALTDRIGERPLMGGGLVLQAVGLGWVALVAGEPYGAMVPALVVAGCGVSMAIPAVQSSVVGAVAPDQIGRAVGVNSMMRELGGVFGIAVGVAVFAGAGSFASAADFTDGFVPAVVAAALISLAGALAALWLPGRAPTPTPVERRVELG
ncbi:drug resistance transporter, EmrB/QacA subfamily [Kribbella flavida DSM 17836]|uniref:Drug resistance transporter, EmrB/QacA subfamily n=1 Tax=Kribbella flavida (strain DSM 17836 / JCM 10339 / NBRC 14399) TaxID=479435 RepID=D2Q4Z6_KRIFD|nr:MFS transporter [Kribbella flavida]ADB34251.1 drug resistance transporter, EmrB/QacA subfamily [Kribbella flavida DSM 17836]